MPTASQKPKGYGIGVEHQGADLAAGSGGVCHGGGRRGTPDRGPLGRRRQGPRQRPGLILAAADAVGTLGGSTPSPMAQTSCGRGGAGRWLLKGKAAQSELRNRSQQPRGLTIGSGGWMQARTP